MTCEYKDPRCGSLWSLCSWYASELGPVRVLSSEKPRSLSRWDDYCWWLPSVRLYRLANRVISCTLMVENLLLTTHEMWQPFWVEAIDSGYCCYEYGLWFKCLCGGIMLLMQPLGRLQSKSTWKSMSLTPLEPVAGVHHMECASHCSWNQHGLPGGIDGRI